jgi:hypothetical protein
MPPLLSIHWPAIESAQDCPGLSHAAQHLLLKHLRHRTLKGLVSCRRMGNAGQDQIDQVVQRHQVAAVINASQRQGNAPI